MDDILQATGAAGLSIWTLLASIAILVATWLVSKVVVRLLRRIGEAEGNPLPSGAIFGNIARVAIWTLGAGVVLKVCFGIDITGIIAALGVGGIALSLGFQDTLSNLIGGLQVSLGRLVLPGSYIEVLGQVGRVKDISWRHTTIVDANDKDHLVPNSLINKNSLVVYGDTMTVDVPIAVPVSADLDEFAQAASDAATRALGGACVAGTGAKVLFQGMKEGHVEGVLEAEVLLCEISPGRAKDVMLRAVEAACKAIGRG